MDIQLPLSIDDIVVSDGRRELDRSAVNRLAESIEQIGLRHPITVREKGDQYILVAGRHRLEACKKLGREHVPAIIVKMTNDEARLWEIAENLHRADLKKQERDEQLAEWVKITERMVSGQLVHKPQGGRPEGGIAAAARELGIDRKDAERALKVASLSPEAKQAARDTGLDDNRSALLQAAKEDTAERQTAVIHDIASRRTSPPSNHPKDEAELSMQWRRAFERVWNQSPSADDRDWAREWIDKPIMDARYGA